MPADAVPTRAWLRGLPKAELHCHLDGSLRPATMVDLARDARVALPTTDPAALAAHMRADDVRDLVDYIARFDLTIPLLQTPEAIERVAYELVEDVARDGVRYLEVRYCPRLSTRGGLPLREAMAAEWRGLARGGRDFGVTARVINCSLRHYDPAVSLELARASVAAQDLGVVAFDLAGGEAGHPPGPHRAAFDAAVRGGLGITVHAGEAAGPESIAGALFECHAQRLGHATRLEEDPVLLRHVRDRRVCVEANITSNVQTRAVAAAADHPAARLLRAGLPVTLATDNRLISGVTLTDEYWTAHAALGCTREELVAMIVTGFEHAFLPWPDRVRLLDEIRPALGGGR